MLLLCDKYAPDLICARILRMALKTAAENYRENENDFFHFYSFEQVNEICQLMAVMRGRAAAAVAITVVAVVRINDKAYRKYQQRDLVLMKELLYDQKDRAY